MNYRVIICIRFSFICPLTQKARETECLFHVENFWATHGWVSRWSGTVVKGVYYNDWNASGRFINGNAF